MSEKPKIIHLHFGTIPAFVPRAALEKHIQESNTYYHGDPNFEELMRYLNSDFGKKNYEFNNIFGKRPFDIIFQGQIMNIIDEIPETTLQNTIKIYLRFLREPGKPSTDEFFKQRGWSLTNMKLNTSSFDDILQRLQDKTYIHDHQRLVESLGMVRSTNESSNGTMITCIIIAAFCQEGFQLENEFTIEIPMIHKVQADHVIYDEKGFPLLITEDKSFDMTAALIQNLDQLRSFSMTSESNNCKLVYGLISNQKDWIFTCYIRPEDRRDVEQKNFLISQKFPLSVLIETRDKLIRNAAGVMDSVQIKIEVPRQSETEILIQTLRGFVLYGNIGGMMEEMILKSHAQDMDRVKREENGLEISFSKNDPSLLLQNARACIMEKIKEGETLLDVFAGSGALSILAAKKALQVYANETSPECYQLFLSNVKKHKLENVEFYVENTGKFIKGMILEKKTDHICLLEPNNSMRYLDNVVQAFQHITDMNYSPYVYICGLCKGDPNLMKMNIVRQVECALTQENAIDLEADILNVEKLNSAYIYCLQFRLLQNLVLPPEEKKLEPYLKKIHMK